MTDTTNNNAEPTPEQMKLYDYKTGEEIRDLTYDEAARYHEACDTGATGDTGAVNGEEFGCVGTVYAQ